MAGGTIRIRRAYDPPEPADGYRVLVDRLWPRGRRRDALDLDEWCRDIAPSTDLRRWFAHDPARWDEFRGRYGAELAGNPHLARLAAIARRRPVTLVHAAADAHHNHAMVLLEALRAEAEHGGARTDDPERS